MQKKKKKSPLTAVVVSAVLVIALSLAGTVLRMHRRNMDFVPAFRSFMADTFALNTKD